MEAERLVSLITLERSNQLRQQSRTAEWHALRDKQPLYIDVEDTVVGIDKRLLQSEAAFLASSESQDLISYTLEKAANSKWLINETLSKDEENCHGPKKKRVGSIIGKKVLVCNTQARIDRALEYSSNPERS
jgi:hypothetical protein